MWFVSKIGNEICQKISQVGLEKSELCNSIVFRIWQNHTNLTYLQAVVRRGKCLKSALNLKIDIIFLRMYIGFHISISSSQTPPYYVRIVHGPYTYNVNLLSISIRTSASLNLQWNITNIHWATVCLKFTS